MSHTAAVKTDVKHRVMATVSENQFVLFLIDQLRKKFKC